MTYSENPKNEEPLCSQQTGNWKQQILQKKQLPNELIKASHLCFIL
jgi:hypothetical protein